MKVGRNDPTASGFATPPGAARLSGNETEMLCQKAARGAGMAWGLAEEAGFAAKWLQSRGIDGPTALLFHLQPIEGRDWAAISPVAPGTLRPRGPAPLCPIAAGATLSDLAALPDEGIGPVAMPVLLLPFLHSLARACNKAVLASWRGGEVTVTPGGDLGGDPDRLAMTEEATIALSLFTGTGAPPAAAPAGHRPPPATLAGLHHYAMKTTVPASGSSRVDAGAAGGDND